MGTDSKAVELNFAEGCYLHRDLKEYGHKKRVCAADLRRDSRMRFSIDASLRWRCM